jgi:ABC-type Fe3+/spermidine/putrescine transport system ATPase subunit
MTGLSVRGLTVRRGSRFVLEDISVSAAAGAVTAILGPAGAGKTTLLAAIAGLLASERGAVFLGGTELDSRAARRRIGFLAPGTALPDARDVPAALRRITARQARQSIAEASAALAPGLAGAAPSHLSHGESLLALTVARLLPAGDALLVDEAGMGLDDVSIHRASAYLQELAAGGRTVLLATRSPSMALLADHLVLLAGGQMLQAGTPGSLYAEPRNEAAARLTGTANVFQGRIRELRQGAFVWTEGGRFLQATDPDMPRPTLGTEIAICIRPERIQLLASGEAADNMLDAEIIDMRSAGPLLHVRVQSPLGEVIASVPSWRPGSFHPAIGQQGRIGWSAAAGWVLPTP